MTALMHTCPYRSVAEIRAALGTDKSKPPLRASNAAARKYRAALGLTQQQMAERFGLAPRTIRNYEQGRQGVSPAVMMAMKGCN